MFCVCPFFTWYTRQNGKAQERRKKIIQIICSVNNLFVLPSRCVKREWFFCSGTGILRQQVTQPVSWTLNLSSYFIRQEPLRPSWWKNWNDVMARVEVLRCAIGLLPVIYAWIHLHLGLIHFSPHTRPEKCVFGFTQEFLSFFVLLKRAKGELFIQWKLLFQRIRQRNSTYLHKFSEKANRKTSENYFLNTKQQHVKRKQFEW